VNIATAVRNAVDDRLRNDARVIAAFGPSKVRLDPLAPPTNPTFPYALYRVEVVGDDTECAEGSETTVMIDVYAREATYALSVDKAEAIAGAARKALTSRLALTDHQVDDWLFEFDRPITDPDLLTEHRSLALTYQTSATA
jgi:hypothetical protein